MPLDEIEVYREIGRLRDQLNEVEQLPLHKLLSTILSLIESAHERITDLTDAEDNDE